ncbi:MAG TPA: hypothetical protein VK176_13015 [Phycisphaerales bacterium]|nr:hypothetical protein [Phycisphaerales bacterium]
MRSYLLIAACGAVAAAATSSSAAIVWANTVEAFSQGLQDNNTPVDANRSNPNNALGAAQNNNTINFVSLGVAGSLTLSFGELFKDEVTVFETTFPPINQHIEKAAVYVGFGATAATATYWLAGNVINSADGAPISLAAAEIASGRTTFKYVKIVDTTEYATSTSTDGFDVDAVSVRSVPAPGAVALASVGGLLVARRRRNG